MDSFKNTFLSGMRWTTLSAVVKSVVRLLQIAILTRFLPKSDFGTIAIAILFIGFTELFLDMGISSAILHRQHISRQEYSSLFWLNIFTGVLLTFVLWIVSPLIAHYYQDDSLIRILQLLSLNVLFSSVGRQHSTIQQKKMNFKLLANVELITYVCTFIIAVTLAYTGAGVYSLVYSTMFSVAFPNIVYLIYGIRKDANIHFHFRFRETYPFLKIGVFQLSSSFLDYISKEFDVFIISTAFGKDVLGVYSLCKKIVQMVYTLINPILTKVLTPMFAEIQNQNNRLKTNYLRIVNILATTNYPVYVLMAVLSSSILNILYGNEFVEGKYVLTFLALSYGLMSIANPVGTLQVALGRTDIGFYWTIFRVFTNTLFIYVGAQFSIDVLAFSLLLYNLLIIIPFWYMQIRPMIKVSFVDYLRCQFLQLIIALACALPLVLFYNSVNVFISVTLACVYLLLYIFGLRLFDKNNYFMLTAVEMIINLKRSFNNSKESIINN